MMAFRFRAAKPLPSDDARWAAIFHDVPSAFWLDPDLWGRDEVSAEVASPSREADKSDKGRPKALALTPKYSIDNPVGYWNGRPIIAIEPSMCGRHYVLHFDGGWHANVFHHQLQFIHRG